MENSLVVLHHNGIHSSKSNGKDNKLEYNFVIICSYFNIAKTQRIILQQIEKSQVLFVCCIKISTLWENICYFHLTLHERGHFLFTLKGNNSC